MFVNSIFQDLNFEFKDKPKKVLALIGPRRTGKTVLAQWLVEKDSRFQLRSFADPLKEMFAEFKGVSVGDLYHRERKEKYREDLVEFSSKIKLDRGVFFWAEAYFNSIPLISDFFVVDDIRFIQELQLLCMFGGVAYRVWAEPYQRRAWGWIYDPLIDDNMSEQDLTRLSAYDLFRCTGGGYIFNTKEGKDYPLPQLSQIISKHFPAYNVQLESLVNLVTLVTLEL